MAEYHIPVLLDESVSALITDLQGTYADVTFGGGGHTAEILSRLHDDGKVIAFDRDMDAIQNAPADPRLELIHNNFRFLENYAALLSRQGAERPGVHGGSAPIKQPNGGEYAVFDGILADLGVSSHQFDTAERGFSFRFDAPLDMRMNTAARRTAADLVNEADEEELGRILRLYGEVDGAARMARLIVEARKSEPIRTTSQLDAAIARMLPKGAEHKVLAKVYQALRIEVNEEMRSLEKFLEGSVHCLKPGGRLVVITYHSLEDRMVKNFMRTGRVDGQESRDIYGRSDAPLSPLGRKPILPTEDEIAGNTRARSAKLRIAVKAENGPEEGPRHE